MLHQKRIQTLLVPLLALSACDGCDLFGGGTQLITQQKMIAVDICTTEPNIDGKGGVEGCGLTFDLTSLSVRVQKDIQITAVGEEEIIITGWRFSESSDPAYLVEHMPDRIKAGVTTAATISFRPLLESAVGAELILTTDAENAPNGEIHININGSGVDNGLPTIKVEVVNSENPEACCDLGLVAVGSVANCQIRVSNEGTKPLILEDILFVDTDATAPWEFVGARPDPNDSSDDARFTINPGERKQLSFKFKPTDLDLERARVQFVTNSPRSCGPVGTFDGNTCNARTYADPCPAGTAGVVTVDLKGQGAEPPTCIARIKSVNNETSFDPRLIEPLDDVELTAEDSETSVPGLTITGYKWTITLKPPGSGVRFDNDTSMTPRIVFDNSSTNIINGLDVAGNYEVRCEAIDSRGTKSVNDGQAIVAFTATPSEAIHAQLVWDAPEVDVDLHLVREVNGSFDQQSDDDCYYANCKPGTDGPIWDSAHNAHEGGNPVLDVDDTQGYGPENSNINEPLPGRYKVIVHYFSDDGIGPTVATLRMYLYGNLVAEYQQFIHNQDWWEVGIVEWPANGGPTWTEVNMIQ